MVLDTSIHIVHPGGPLQCSTYLVAGAKAAVLIDPGSGFDDAEVLAGIARSGVTLDRIAAVLLTHCHADHVLGVPRFRERGLRVFAAKETADILRRADPQIWGEHPELIRPIEVDDELRDGQELLLDGLEIECLTTVGHTCGCMSYIVSCGRDVVTFTGDLLMPDPHYPGWAEGPDFSLVHTLASLARLQARGVTRAYTGHGTVDDAQTWLRQGIELGRRGEWVLERAYKMRDLPAGLTT